MNPCVRTKIICAKEEDLDLAENLGMEPKYYWIKFSFKIYNIETYEEVQKEDLDRVLVKFLDGSEVILKMTFEELVHLEDEYYANQGNQALWRTAN